MVLHQKQHFRKIDSDKKKTRKLQKNVSKIVMETRLQKDTTPDQFSFYFELKNHEK